MTLCGYVPVVTYKIYQAYNECFDKNKNKNKNVILRKCWFKKTQCLKKTKHYSSWWNAFWSDVKL